MIAHIEGNIISRADKFVVLDVGGIGYRVYVSPDTLGALSGKDSAELFTHLVVKEDILDLYGFLSEEELLMFEMLIGISGVGPRSAIGILGVAPPKTLKAAISAGDTSYLTKVSGIGRKNAEKIILELRDKFGPLEEGTNGMLKEDSEVIEALTALGYGSADARDTLKKVPAEISGTNNRIKEALKLLGKAIE